MGVVADAALAAGGRVTGVIPTGLVDRELAHPAVTELRIVATLHERKAVMAELADAFLAKPGGLGTLEELAEVLSWAQLGLHAKPIGALDVGGFYGPLLAHLDHAASEGFVSSAPRAADRGRPPSAAGAPRDLAVARRPRFLERLGTLVPGRSSHADARWSLAGHRPPGVTRPTRRDDADVCVDWSGPRSRASEPAPRSSGSPRPAPSRAPQRRRCVR
jgi:hypothetical protein